MDYTKTSDPELIDSFKVGDKEAFNELFRRYRNKVFNVALRYTAGDRHASEDVVHEVFLEIYQNIHKFRGEGRFFAYLYGIAFNKARKWVYTRNAKREVSLFPEEGDPESLESTAATIAPDESVRQIHDKKELARLLDKALQSVPETTRQAFILSEIQGLDYGEVGKALGISRATVGWHIFDARKRLRALLPLEMLQIFLYWRWTMHEDVKINVQLWAENAKLFLGIASPLLLSHYVDGETTPWQRQRIESLLKTNPRFNEEYSHFQKIKILFGQIEESELDAGIDARFERRLAAIEEESETMDLPSLAQRLLSLLPRPAVLVPVLAVLIATVNFLWFYPLLLGSPLSITALEGAVQIFDPQTSSWAVVVSPLDLRQGMKLRTGPDGKADLLLPGKMQIRVKENAEIVFQALLRTRQKGDILLKQNGGKILAGLGPRFKGSRLSIETPHGRAHAYGTLFLVEVAPSPERTRVLVLEGTVEVEDLLKQTLQSVIPQTERILTRKKVEESTPLSAERKQDIQELQGLMLGHDEKRKESFLEEHLSLGLTVGPDRVRRYLDAPKILVRREYPILTQKILQAGERTRQAYAESRPELYEETIKDLEQFAEEYLDPLGQFQPHIDFFIGAFHHFLGNEQEALKSFAKVIAFPEKRWQSMAHLARGIIDDEFLKAPDEARQEYEKVLEILPKSPEAADAKGRLQVLEE